MFVRVLQYKLLSQERSDGEFSDEKLTLSPLHHKCGCMCVRCCAGRTCRDAGPNTQCDVKTAGEECVKFDESVCGPQFSSSLQAVFCSIKHPSSWPPLFKVTFLSYALCKACISGYALKVSFLQCVLPKWIRPIHDSPHHDLEGILSD